MSALPIMVSLLGNAAGFNHAVNGAKTNLDNFASSLARSRAMMGTLGVTAAGAGFASLGQSIFKAHERNEAIAIGLKVTTGSLQGSREEMEFVRREAERLGHRFLDLAHGYKNLTASTTETNLAGEKTRNIFSSLMEAATVYRLSVDDVNGVMRAMTQIMSKGTVQTEELNQIAERMPGVFNAAAKSMGMTTAKLRKELELGKVNSVKFIEAYSGAMRKLVAGELPEAINTGTAALGRMYTAWDNLIIAIGKSGVVDVMTKMMNALNFAMTLLENNIKQTTTAQNASIVTAKAISGPMGMAAELAMRMGFAYKNISKEAGHVITEKERLSTQLSEQIVKWQELTDNIKLNEESLKANGDRIKASSPQAFAILTESLNFRKAQAAKLLAEIQKNYAVIDKTVSEFEKNKKRPAPKVKNEILSDDKVKLSVETEIMMEEESKALDAFNEKLKEAKALYKSLIETPSDEFAEDIQKLKFLADEGAISWENFGKSAEEAHIRMTEAWEKFNKKHEEDQDASFKRMVDNWQSSTDGVVKNFLEMNDSSQKFYLENEHRAINLRTLMIDVFNTIMEAIISYFAEQAALMVTQAIFSKTVQQTQTAFTIAQAKAINTAMAPAAINSSIATSGGASLAGGAAYASAMASGISLSVLGAAAGGLDNVPTTGTYILHEGEKVIKKDQNKKLGDFLNDQARSIGESKEQSSQNIYNIRVVLNSQSIDSRGMDAVAKTIAPSIMREMSKVKRNQLRSTY